MDKSAAADTCFAHKFVQTSLFFAYSHRQILIEERSDATLRCSITDSITEAAHKTILIRTEMR